jgi:hypothetical protein
MGSQHSIIAPIRVARAMAEALPPTASIDLADASVVVSKTTNAAIGAVGVGAVRVPTFASTAPVRVPTGPLDGAADIVVRDAGKFEAARIIFDLQTSDPGTLNAFITSVQHTGATTPALLVNLVAYTIDSFVTAESLTRFVALSDVTEVVHAIAGAACGGGVDEREHYELAFTRAFHPAYACYARTSVGAAVTAAYAGNLFDEFATYAPARALVDAMMFSAGTAVSARTSVSVGALSVTALTVAFLIAGIVVWWNLTNHASAAAAAGMVESHAHVHGASSSFVAMVPAK